MGTVDVADARVTNTNPAARRKEDDFIAVDLRRLMRWQN
jgi:hypothetical protein